MSGTLLEIWSTPAAAQPMRRLPAGVLVAGAGLEGDRYARGGGTWARYPDLEKQLTLIDADEVAALAAETGAALGPGDTRRNLVTRGIDLPGLVGRWFTVGGALLFGMKRCPPCTHLERLTGAKLVKAMAYRGGVNAAVFAGAPIAPGDPVRLLDDDEAVRRGAPSGADRPVPRRV
ncbi:MOSC domain-containing protein [Trujillonella endophytica]|uniref:MOSC domain-containing protein n=1 Tax=Trujillonella endophytica TaxID=673521 RepID=A0A1H8R518_9ACTN|nr:MOSC domain-containing protein [Trujillella endophytica]SEO61013.1 hypothetical protein SAMN05660991_00979 [Trujillella endophytica]